MSSSIPTAPKPSLRLTSLDQFRGYTMLGMLLVNFIGGYKAVSPRILLHTHDYCSYADTIMPHFLFAAGFALRLSLGRRMEAGGKMPWGRAIRRILGLALVAIIWYGYCDWGGVVHKFNTMTPLNALGALFKRDLFATLLHIAVTSLWILPVITSKWTVRFWYMIASGLLHVVISYWFNYEWVYSDPTGIDGGPLGFLTWAVPALCGTLACDAVKASGIQATTRIALCGVGVMLVGWLMSMGTVLYNVPADQIEVDPPAATTPADATTPATEPAPAATEPAAGAEPPKTESTIETPAAAEPPPAGSSTEDSAGPVVADLAPADGKPISEPPHAHDVPPNSPAAEDAPVFKKSSLDPKKYAPDPVLPTMARIKAWDGSIVEPPFVPPPDLKHRKWNYWMMSQRGGTLSYPTFAAGVSLVIYAFFLWFSDGLKIQIGMLRTLGTNSLAAYILHDIAGWIFDPLIKPHYDALVKEGSLGMAGVWAWGGLVAFTLFVYGICRLFERLGWYIRV
ncbi:heparan-alpha-glucosaminide N-acetyltransferase domain-containing protein [Schlesneria paludicola]|uniref:heparan-alpha-glucosaminide N-acetyltransferase domain-containing protein n=1 Tax=Schlesneria paludicola TaxID=360056 RepID=UPI00029B0AE6|nr:heparan-alpha-glucosaminide N-acetyltransferase domain-containing protein [Schlesneria paludicola]